MTKKTLGKIMEKFAQELKLFPALVLVSPRGSA